MIRLALLVSFIATTLPAQDLMCIGTRPGFIFVVSGGDRVTFDYLGDGRFRLDPPLVRDEPTRHDLVTRRERWPVLIEERACRVLNTDHPVTLEIGVPTSAGMRPLTGCCRWSRTD